MGIHHWTGYVGYKTHCCEALKNNLELFCFGCHTPDDVKGCHNCGIGRANDMMIEYLKDELKPNKKLDKLASQCAERDGYFKIRQKYRVKRPAKKYVDQVKKTLHKKVDQKKWAFMIQLWARNTHECEKIKNIIDELYKAKTKY